MNKLILFFAVAGLSVLSGCMQSNENKSLTNTSSVEPSSTKLTFGYEFLDRENATLIANITLGDYSFDIIQDKEDTFDNNEYFRGSFYIENDTSQAPLITAMSSEKGTSLKKNDIDSHFALEKIKLHDYEYPLVIFKSFSTIDETVLVSFYILDKDNTIQYVTNSNIELADNFEIEDSAIKMGENYYIIEIGDSEFYPDQKNYKLTKK